MSQRLRAARARRRHPLCIVCGRQLQRIPTPELGGADAGWVWGCDHNERLAALHERAWGYR